MSKSEEKKGQKVENLAAGMLGVEYDAEGFQSLKPTDKGKKDLDRIKVRRSKLSKPAAPKSDETDNPKEEVKPFDLDPMSDLLDTLEDYVKDGKYGKALNAVNAGVIDAFVNAFMKDMPVSSDKSMNGMVKKFLSICKSYYEYDEKNRELIDNITYDGLLAKFLKDGSNKEPTGIIPKGLKTLKKVAITYPTLHNNVDKAYAVRDKDPIPEGVKESDTVEAFLMRVYKALDMTPEMELKLDISPKLDGVSVNATVKDNVIVNPQSRGDNDESVAIMGMDSMEVTTDDFKAEKKFGIQYEAFVTETDRLAASEYLKLSKPYVSCRHAAAGIVHRLSTMEDDGLLQFISLYPITTEGLEGTYSERMDYISNFGIVPDDMIERQVISGSMGELIGEIRDLFNKFAKKRETISYAIDGLVITVVDDEYQEILGREERTNKFQLALKFDPASAVAVVDGITLDCGKKGFRTIQVWMEHPVFLDGVRYDHVPVLSANLYEGLNLRRGSRVNVHRVGDVIPAISVLEEGNGKKLRKPEVCPKCNELLEIKDKKLFCGNPRCPGNVVGRFTGFFEKLDMTGYSDAFSEILHDQLKCVTISDLMKLSNESFKSAGVMLKQALEFPKVLREALKKKSDFEILGAMGLPKVGPARAKIILNKVPFNKLGSMSSIKAMSIAVEAVGENAAFGLSEVFGSKDFTEDIKALVPYVTMTKDFTKMIRVGHTGGKLSPEAIKVCRDNKFEIVEGKSFDILITPSMDRSSSKMDVAKSRNLPIFTEAGFIDQYEIEESEDEDETEEK